MNWNNLRFAWSKYYPWYFLADVFIWIALIGALLRWLLK